MTPEPEPEPDPKGARARSRWRQGKDEVTKLSKEEKIKASQAKLAERKKKEEQSGGKGKAKRPWEIKAERKKKAMESKQKEIEMPSKEERTKLFNRMDNNGNGGLSLAEIDKGIIELYPAFNCKPALMRAYKAADKSGDGFIERREFRLLLHYLVYFNNIFHKFEEIDKSLAIRFYKEALKLLLDQRKIQDEKVRSLMSLNHVLALKIRQRLEAPPQESSDV